MSAKTQNILLLGAGGRECTLAWKLKNSPLCGNLYIAPGNAGTGDYGANLPFSVTDFEGIKKACKEYNIDILLPGPEDPLVEGIYDFVKGDAELAHIIVVGPSKEGAQLEGSKAFSKKFMERHNIPTAAYREFTADSFDEGVSYLNTCLPPIVLKADGLAAGKGVVIAQSVEEAQEAFHAMLKDRQFGDAGSKVVIEQFLDGIEMSVFVLTDGQNYVLLPEAKDYKRIGEGDRGLNTGGMGAISPVPFADKEFMQKVTDRIINPTVDGLRSGGIVYQGFIFFGLIKVAGEPFVIEYNCRMGDPETEVVMPRLENDLVALILKMHEGKLNEVTVTHSAHAAGAVMLVSGGYPGDYAKGKVMSGFAKVKGSMLFHAGTTQMANSKFQIPNSKSDGYGGQIPDSKSQIPDSAENDIVTSGGRVIAVTSYGTDIKQALAKSYENAAHIEYEGRYYRTDIGWEFQ